MTRRFISFLILNVLLLAQAAPLAAGAAHCSMMRHASPAPCCDLAGSEKASLEAGTCCHFEAATPRTQTPCVLPAPQGSCDNSVPLAVLALAPRLEGPARGFPASVLPQPRSTDSPVSLRTTLRL